jgi:alkylation response protein AidB-like acyl-CoA dehydrogenase
VGELLQAVDAVGVEASGRTGEIDELRRLPDDLAAALVDTGVFRACVPARYGGGELPLLDLLAAGEALAYHEASTAWCAVIGATTGLTAAFLPAAFAEEIYGDPRAVTGGYALPAGTAKPVEGGAVVDGRWSWGSGTAHCTWIGGGCRMGDRAPFVFFERAQVDLLDTWRTVGLRGTGSTDYEVRGAFVPEGRWVDLGGRPPVVDGPLYRFPFLAALALGVCSVGLGLARRALDELVDLAGAKRPAQSSRLLAERPVVQAEVARAEAARRSAWAFVAEAVAAAWSAAADGDPLTAEHARLLRLAATDATWRSADAVDLAYHAGGGSSIHEASPLQRVFRDMHVVTQHGMVAERTYEPLGRIALGLPTDARSL